MLGLSAMTTERVLGIIWVRGAVSFSPVGEETWKRYGRFRASGYERKSTPQSRRPPAD